ncbi:MAG: hypothetical protein IT558_03125 [Alphaproteobacteria bacterium]|nr:hypothetical protein [Alphaproteobacteria bacterium]
MKKILPLLAVSMLFAAPTHAKDEFGQRFTEQAPNALGKGGVVEIAPQDIEPAAGEEAQDNVIVIPPQNAAEIKPAPQEEPPASDSTKPAALTP